MTIRPVRESRPGDLDADVVVVGAGFAGVTAARELTWAGARAVVIEARDRIGGRTWTKDSPLGLPLDMGGTWVHWVQPHVWAEIVRYDLPVTSSPIPEVAYSTIGGKLEILTSDALMERLDEVNVPFLAGCRGYFPDPHDPLALGDEIRAVDDLSVADRIAELDLRPVQVELLESFWTLNFNGPLTDAAYSQALRWCALTGGDWSLMFEACGSRKIHGGTAALLRAIAADTTADIMLNTHVTGIAHTPDGVEVATADGGVVRGREVIVTVPLGALPGVAFQPELEPAKRRAAERGQVSRGVKVWARVRGPQQNFVAIGPASAGLNFAQAEYCVDGDTVIVAFGADADALGPEDAAVQEQLRQWLPDVEVLASDRHDWVADELSRETWPMLRVGQLLGELPALQRAEGRVRLAGSDYATGWSGFIDGAIESGKTAARKALQGLGPIRGADHTTQR